MTTISASPAGASVSAARWRSLLRHLAPAPVSWTTVLVLSATMAYADGFVLTSLQGAVGAIERSQGPFVSWLYDSTLALPIFVVAVLAAVGLVRRRFLGALNRPRMVAAALLLIVAAGTTVGIGQALTSSIIDYRLQSRQIEVMHADHTPAPAQAAPGAGQQHQAMGTCSIVCSAQTSTLRLHVRAVTYASGVMLAANLILVTWVLAMRGGQLVSTARRTS